jgi:uncharacterized protein
VQLPLQIGSSGLACNGGNATGCNNLAVLFEKTDRALALQLYAQACDGGLDRGCENLKVFSRAP